MRRNSWPKLCAAARPGPRLSGGREGLLGVAVDGRPGDRRYGAYPCALNHGDPDWWMQTGELAYEANYQLINDNLLDLAHLSYVHENTLGRNSMSWGESKPTVTPIPRGLRIARWVVNNPSPRYLTVPGGASHVDMWASYDYMVPGIFLLGTRTYPVGTAAAHGMQAPDPHVEPLTATTTSQAVTPIDELHTIYYYSGCLPRRLAGECPASGHAAAPARTTMNARRLIR